MSEVIGCASRKSILGVQFFLAGFLGELIDRNASDRNKYLIDKNI